jgi:hypothetical protein
MVTPPTLRANQPGVPVRPGVTGEIISCVRAGGSSVFRSMAR